MKTNLDSQVERTLRLIMASLEGRDDSGGKKRQKSACPFTKCVGTVMSNFDHEVNPDAAERLNGDVYGHHTAVEFCANVWKDGALYRSEVWRYRVPQRPIYEAATLEDLMQIVNDHWGWE